MTELITSISGSTTPNEEPSAMQIAMAQAMLRKQKNSYISRTKSGLCKNTMCDNKRAHGSSRCEKCAKSKKDAE